MSSGKTYADILLPLARGTYTYRIADEVRDVVRAGMCVEAELGRKLYTGVVWRFYDEEPGLARIKTAGMPVQGAPVIGGVQMRLWEWMADYYMCGVGDVMRAALPSALRPRGFSREELERGGYRRPTVRYVSLSPDVGGEDALNDIFEKLRRRAPKQYEALVEFVAMAGEHGLFSESVPMPELTSDPAALTNLVKKGILVVGEHEVPEGELPPLPRRLPELTALQAEAVDSIKEQFAYKNTVLLHGVTGSGKTEIYLNLILEQLRAGRDVLYLMPEIAMTSQMIRRMEHWFRGRVVAYHSAFADRARMAAYMRASSGGGGKLIFGTRSAIFLPQGDLGLVIIDEEHDPGYKNHDSAPRYHARDAAAVLARMAGAKLLLGSATPSLESRWNAHTDKYGYVSLTERYGGAPLPQVEVSDTLRDVKRGERRTHFNKLTRDRIGETLAAGRQVMLFQNRRGFAPYVECAQCGWIPVCPHCNVSLTLHKNSGRLECHYCGYGCSYDRLCPECGAAEVEPRGFGTEKVENEIARLFPEARVARLDRDTARSPGRYNAIVSAFESGHTDILVGTQIITKGFDFGGVGLICVLNADNLLAYPDFRASERAFQTIMQVAGRAGRRELPGRVVVQTSHPSHPVIRHVAANDYEAMAREQLAERAAFFYPPYCRLVSLTLRHRDPELLGRAAGIMGERMRAVFGQRVSGPQSPAVERVRDEYLLGFLVKIEKDKPFADARRLLSSVAGEVGSTAEFRGVAIAFDVDPQ